MGARKRLAAEKRKEEKKQQNFAILRDVPTSPRKMRLVADMIRGMEVKFVVPGAGEDMVTIGVIVSTVKVDSA